MPVPTSRATRKTANDGAQSLTDEALPWVKGTAPARFWMLQENRRAYMEWLGLKLGYRQLDDWRRLQKADFDNHFGRNLFARCFGKSVFRAVSETFPEHEWREWQFDVVPFRFWKDAANRRQFMIWLEKRLGYRRPEDWYQVTADDFRRFGGSGLLFNLHSPIHAVIEAFPEHDWKPWLFRQTPPDYWKKHTHRKAYMQWLGKRLGFQKATDWYGLRVLDFQRNGGNFLLDNYYGGSVIAALSEYIPKHDWKPWLFEVTGSDYWDDVGNRRKYLDWLGKKLRLRKPDDWRRLHSRHFIANDGGTLLKRHYRFSLAAAMREYLPELEWEPWTFEMVPREFWQSTSNRRGYMQWLEHKLGIQKPEGWYGVTTIDIKRWHGSQFLAVQQSLSNALREFRPDYDWMEWRMTMTPRDFWAKSVNRRRYMDWLAKELDIRRPEDWYAVTGLDVRAKYGARALVVAGGVCALVRERYPDYDWKEWLFAVSRPQFWKEPAVRRRYLKWLALVLEYRRPEDWLRVRVVDFEDHRGLLLLRFHGGSPVRVVMENLPELGLKEEDFASTMIKHRRRRKKRQRKTPVGGR